MEYSDRYISDKFLPDKAIDVMDEAGAKVHLANISVPREITMLEERLKVIRSEKENGKTAMRCGCMRTIAQGTLRRF